MKKLLLLLFTLSLFLLSCGKSGEDVKNAVSKKAYTVDFNTNGGTTVSAITVEEGKTITEPSAPTKEGFTFEGWYKETGFTNKWTFATEVVNVDVTLYAKWATKTYTVSFETDGGTTVSALTVEEGKTITEPSAPTKTGFAFEGWYKETGLTNKWTFSTDVVNTDVTLYAKWKEILLKTNEVFVEKGTAGRSGLTIDKSFYIQKYEVIQKDFREVMTYNLSFFSGDYKPVEHVTWYDAINYANELSKKEKLSPYYNITVIDSDGLIIKKATVTENTSANGYRLPTSEEWEYAARGGKKSNNYTYAGSDNPNEVAWTTENDTAGGETSGTKVVGRKKPNELGIYDMSGNVWEWTNTLNNQNYRGGSCMNGVYGATVVLINSIPSPPNLHGKDLGFRLVRAF